MGERPVALPLRLSSRREGVVWMIFFNIYTTGSEIFTFKTNKEENVLPDASPLRDTIKDSRNNS